MRRRTLATLSLAVLVLTTSAAPVTAAAPAPPAPLTLSDTGECRFGGKDLPGRPWSLQRVQLDRLWQESRGKGIRVAVIDSGVDVKNRQLSGAVDRKAGKDLLKRRKDEPKDTPRGPTVDNVGHGTKVAGIIAARPRPGTGFVGLAPEATIIPIRQNDGEGEGDVLSLAQAVGHAIDAGAHQHQSGHGEETPP